MLAASAFALAALAALASAAPQAAVRLRTEYLTDPAIVAPAAPRFSWVLPSAAGDRGVAQSAYQVVVTSVTAGGATVWDSGKVASGATNQVAFGGAGGLAADSRFAWTVTWWDQTGAAAPASAPAFFGTAPGDDAAWAAAGAEWIGCTGAGGMANANMLRVDFLAQPASAGLTVVHARLYASGLGWFLPMMNGAPLAEGVMLDPAFTNLRMRVLYNAYDVTSLLDTSARGNTFAAFLGHGWPEIFAPWGGSATGEAPWNGTGSSVGLRSARAELAKMTQEEMELKIKQGLGHGHTGYERRLRAWLSVRWSDGSTTSVVSSASAMGRRLDEAAAPSGWQCGSGPLLADDLYGGCTWDARLETPGWNAQGFNYSTGQWADAVRIAAPGGAMSPAVHEPVKIVGELAPCAMWESTPGAYVFDLCQNFAGVVRLSLPGPTQPGVAIVIRHAEAIMHPPYGARDGTLYYGNLRSAEATDTYTTRGSDNGETFVPLFTWHGFRYVEVSGLPFTPTLTGTITGLNLRSAMEPTGSLSFPSSASTMNQLQHAIFWGQASNLLGNPSDCPQRDERLGWTGDSALTSEESALNFDMAAFLSNWAATIDDSLNNMVDSTWKSGGLPETIPDITGGYNADASWSSVFPTTVHTLWKAYGDVRVAQTYWSDLMLYINETVAGMKGGDIAGIFSTWGDWCPPGAAPGDDQGAKPDPAFSAGGTFLGDLANVIEMAVALNSPDAPRLQALWATLAAQFNAHWSHGGAYYGSSPTDGAQTAQAHALGVGVVPAAGVGAIANYLMADIAAHNYHLSVGIIGMKHLSRALTLTGNAYTAVNISLQTDYPSFGWSFTHPDEPATTLWELWNGPSEGPGMNSRNHIMQGAIGAWLYTDVAGIAQAPGTSGYASLLLWPRATTHERLPFASGSFESIRGTVAVQWLAAAKAFALNATVPATAVAEVRLTYPAGTPLASLVAREGASVIFQNGAFVPGAAAGVTGAAVNANASALSVMTGSGVYAFTLSGW
jgi:alpha-L-rhamnosidase